MRILDIMGSVAIKGKKVSIFPLILAGIILFIGASILFISPLTGALLERNKEWTAIHVRLVESEEKLNEIEMLDKAAIESQLEELRKRIPSEGSSSAILDEITSVGKGLKIEFISIMPQQERIITRPDFVSEGLRFKILPIQINMSADYRSTGEFFGKIEGLKNAFVTIGGFQISGKDEPSHRLNVSLTVHVYLLEEENEKR